jgi:pimeloyl-ACP methyl ester carboxylesterase
MTKLIIFLPGLMGSQLFKGTDLIWPGPFLSLFSPYKLMNELLDPDLRVGDIIRSFSISEQYGSLIAKLGQADFTEQNGRLRVFPYDWRKRNEDAAEGLAKLIEKIAAEHNSEVEITLLAHSMGGLISRYYLESGLFDQRPGFSNVRNLFTLATPHRGSPVALAAAVGLERRLFLDKSQVQQLVQHTEFPSVYQLLPPPEDAFAWDDRNRDDLFKPFPVHEHAAELALVPANLKAAADFRAHLTGRAPNGVRYFCFVGTRLPTLTHVRISGDGASLFVRPVPADDGGDGTVPSWSGGLAGVQTQFVGGEHGTIYKDRDLLTTLGGLLGMKNTLAADLSVQASIRDKVMAPSARAHLSISFPVPITGLKGEVIIERAMQNPDGTIRKITQIESHPLAYTGLGAENLSLTFKAPNDPGIYYVRFMQEGKADANVQDDFFIQDTL